MSDPPDLSQKESIGLLRTGRVEDFNRTRAVRQDVPVLKRVWLPQADLQDADLSGTALGDADLLKATGQFVAKHTDQALISVASFVESLKTLIAQGALDEVGKMMARAHRRDEARTTEKEATAHPRLREVTHEDSDLELEMLERLHRVARDREESLRPDALRRAEDTKAQAGALECVASAIAQLKGEGGSAAVDWEQLTGLRAGDQSPPCEQDESSATEDQS